MQLCLDLTSSTATILPGPAIQRWPLVPVQSATKFLLPVVNSPTENEAACLIGCLRRLQHWSMCAVMDEVSEGSERTLHHCVRGSTFAAWGAVLQTDVSDVTCGGNLKLPQSESYTCVKAHVLIHVLLM